VHYERSDSLLDMLSVTLAAEQSGQLSPDGTYFAVGVVAWRTVAKSTSTAIHGARFMLLFLGGTVLSVLP
jgi:hypothetical protein